MTFLNEQTKKTPKAETNQMTTRTRHDTTKQRCGKIRREHYFEILLWCIVDSKWVFSSSQKHFFFVVVAALLETIRFCVLDACTRATFC